MSSVPNPGATPTPVPTPATSTTSTTGTGADQQLVIYRHSNLFYWWPIWVIGFLFAGITYFHNQHLAVVPADTVAASGREVDVTGEGKFEKRDVLILDAHRHLWTKKNAKGEIETVQPTIYITHYRILGSIFVVVLLFVIGATNVHIRGLWTVFFFVVVIMAAIIIAVSNYWLALLQWVNQLAVFINLGGYLFIATVLFVLWLVNFFVFDRQTYIVFTPGQARVRLEIGGEETVYDTAGMVVQRERSDVFRHWLLGFGSGDLIVKPVGLQHPLVFPNVLRIEKMIAEVEQLTKRRVIVR